jgi:hypothetical protein
MTSPDAPRDSGGDDLRGAPRPEVFTLRGHAPSWRRWRWLAVLTAFAICTVFTVYFLSRGAGTKAETGLRATASASHATSANSAQQASPGVSRRRATSAHHGSTHTPEAVVASLHMPPTLAAALRRWDAGPGGSALVKVSDALGNATQDAGVGLYNPMRLACLSLGAAAIAAKADPPIPDAALQRWYGLALGRLTSAAADCRMGISVRPYGDEDVTVHENSALLHQSMVEFVAGAKDLYHVTTDIYGARHHGRP